MNQNSHTGNNNRKAGKFSFMARWRSFKYAIDGIKFFFNAEHNARIHLLATVAVIVLATAISVSVSEAIALTLTIGFVWVAELFNTAIEKMMDFISPEKHPQIKLIKDVSAAAVLVAAFMALITSCLVFIPKI